jgi:hypothetical protein
MFCLLALLCAPAVPPAPAHATMMLTYGYDVAVQSKWTTHGCGRELPQLLEGHAATGLPGLWRIDLHLFSFSPGNVTLTPGWRDAWKAAYATARPHLLTGALRGFFVGDELTAQMLPLADLITVVDTMRATMDADDELPASSRILYYNDSIYMATWKEGIPHNLTHFSLDYYHGTQTGRIGVTVWDLYETYVFPKLGPNTKLLFVPQAYGSKVDALGRSLAQFEDWSLGNLSEYVNWSTRDPRIIGFNPWHLLDRPAMASVAGCNTSLWGCEEVGMANMSRLLSALKVLGGDIRRHAAKADADARAMTA